MHVESLPCIDLDRSLGEARFLGPIAPMWSGGRSSAMGSIGAILPSGARPPGLIASLHLADFSGRSDA